MGDLAGEGGRGEVIAIGSRRRRTSTTTRRMIAIVDGREQDRRRATGHFVIAVVGLWVLGAALIDPLAKGDRFAVALELRAIGALALGGAWLALRRTRVESRRWAIVGVAGSIAIALDAAIEVARGGGMGAPHDAMPLAIAIALAAIAPPRWQIGAPMAATWLIAHVAVLLGASHVAGGDRALGALPGQLAMVAIEVIALALVVAGAQRSWRLAHDLFESRRLGHYRLMSPLGHGMNEVWLAWDEQRRREVALKLLRTPGAAEATRARFEREAECVRALRSPRTVRIYDYGVTDDGFAYMAFEYLRGLDLDALVSAYGPLEPERAYHLMIEAARGLAVAHARGIVHRDVKPANLHCADSNGSEDFVRILDFGVARSIHDTNLTLDGLVVGTPTYMSPEAFIGGDVTPAADVYSLGATFYFALTGQPPFDADNVADLREAHLHAPVVPPSLRARRDLARPLENVLLRCLAKQPHDRYPDAIALTNALEACVGLAPWSREAAARWWHRARVGRVPTVMPTTERTTEVEALPLRNAATTPS